uniref:UPAR/Ly6 domain-containing protein n=1 Tax=Esox lucius TaxID=8010 RepID=A0A3P9AAR2_ESOLU
MKVACFSLLLLLACSFGEALKCNNCIVKGCRNTVETCRPDFDACISAIFLPPAPPLFFRRCINKSDCLLLAGTPVINAQCCYTDRCN